MRNVPRPWLKTSTDLGASLAKFVGCMLYSSGSKVNSSCSFCARISCGELTSDERVEVHRVAGLREQNHQIGDPHKRI